MLKKTDNISLPSTTKNFLIKELIGTKPGFSFFLPFDHPFSRRHSSHNSLRAAISLAAKKVDKKIETSKRREGHEFGFRVFVKE